MTVHAHLPETCLGVQIIFLMNILHQTTYNVCRCDITVCTMTSSFFGG